MSEKLLFFSSLDIPGMVYCMYVVVACYTPPHRDDATGAATLFEMSFSPSFFFFFFLSSARKFVPANCALNLSIFVLVVARKCVTEDCALHAMINTGEKNLSAGVFRRCILL